MGFVNGFIPLLLMFFSSDKERKIDPNVLNKIRTMSRGNVSVVIYSRAGMDDEIEKLIKKEYGKIKYRLPIINSYAVEIPCTCVKKMADCEKISYIADDSEVFSLLDIATQAVGSNIANNTGYTGKNIGVAVLDSGVYPHSDLIKPKNRLIAFKDFVNNLSNPYDDNSHGTHVAGCIAGNGYSSDGKYKGIAPEANIIGVKVMDESGSGSTTDIIAGMQWVVDNKDKYNIRIMNLSIGSSPKQISRFDALSQAVKKVWEKGIVVIAAAGNAGPNSRTITSPGINAQILTVGAADDKRTVTLSDDSIASFSSRGPTISFTKKPDVVAPGVNIMSLASDKSFKPNSSNKQPGGQLEKSYRKASGTSMATPIVSGYAALLLQKNPRLTPIEIKNIIKDNAVSINQKESAQGKGMINIQSMIK